jgi:hypothetical protein
MGSTLSTNESAHSCGSNHGHLTWQSAMSLIRVITDGSPDSHFKFMKLPYDIRREIYFLLMANRDIYITTVDLPGFKSSSKYDYAVRIVEETKPSGILRLSSSSSLPMGVGDLLSRKINRVSLGILRVSHQIYDEAHLIPYTHSTFHIDVIALEYFVDGRAPYQKQSLRSLSLKFDISLLRHEFRYYSYVMLEASCSLTGLKNLKLFTKLKMTKGHYDLTPWINALKVWGIWRHNLFAEVTVDEWLSGLVIFKGILQHANDVARQLSAELSDQTLVEEHRRLATEEFKKLPGCLRKVLMKSLVKLTAENSNVWLPGYPETMY